MARVVILDSAPFIADYYQKSAGVLFNETGGNSGNLAFRYAVASHIGGRGPTYLGWETSPEAMRAAGDVIVMPLANQLGKHTDLGAWARRLEQFNLPVIGVGLGVQAAATETDVELTPGTRSWLDTLVRLAPTPGPNIGARGTYTKDQIARLGHISAAVSIGCPSNFINSSEDIAASVAQGFQRKPERIAVTAGIPYIPALASIEQDLADIVVATGGSYIVQHGLEMLQIARNEFHIMSQRVLEECRAYIRPALTTEEFKTWCRRYAVGFYDVRAWMDALRQFDFVVGTRFHGVMLAIQAGVPAGCIAHDSRTQEMCETMGVPVRHHREINHALTKDNVMDLFQFDPQQYREIRLQLCKSYVGILKSADIELSPGLARLYALAAG